MSAATVEEVTRLLPALTDPQLGVVRDVVVALVFSEPKSPDEWMSAQQVHEEYNVGLSTVHDAMRTGRLPARVPNGRVRGRRARREDVERWLQWM